VAITTSAPRSILADCSSKDTPPMSSEMVSLWFLPSVSKASCTWAASSRVGSRMSVRGMRAFGPALLEHGQHRQHEGGRLARPGLGQAQHVAAFERGRDGADLNGGGGGEACGLDRIEGLVGQAQLIEHHVMDKPFWRSRGLSCIARSMNRLSRANSRLWSCT
jgi:hypothetical protein